MVQLVAQFSQNENNVHEHSLAVTPRRYNVAQGNDDNRNPFLSKEERVLIIRGSAPDSQLRAHFHRIAPLSPDMRRLHDVTPDIDGELFDMIYRRYGITPDHAARQLVDLLDAYGDDAFRQALSDAWARGMLTPNIVGLLLARHGGRI